MIVGVEELLRLVKESSIIEDLSERELNNPEGTGFDIRVDEVYKLEGKGRLGVTTRKTPESKLVASRDKNKSFTLKPGDHCLVKTVEKVNVPIDLLGVVYPRTTLFRSGVALYVSVASPGYSGKLVFGMKNVGHSEFELELGARIAHIVFLKIAGEGSLYRGQWKGGRVHAPHEKQV